ncbi:MAG: nitronate monooxygenase [Pseudomonadota bacterium]
MKTAFTEMFELSLPVVGAPMFLVSGPALVAAVSQAGGLGTLPSLNGRSSQDFAALLDEVEGLTDRPYGVNLILKDNPRLEADLETCLQHRVRMLITSLGDPTQVVERAHARGVKVFCDVVSVRHAAKAAAAGADGLIAVSAGAGGHAGAISALVLVPLLVQRFGLPVLAAGGIVDGRGLAAALCLGASAAYIGTRLIACPESQASDAYQQAVLDADIDDVEYTPEVTGVSANFLRATVDAMRRGEIGPEKRYKNIWSAGQDVALIADRPPAGELVQGMVREASALLHKLAGDPIEAP